MNEKKIKHELETVIERRWKQVVIVLFVEFVKRKTLRHHHHHYRTIDQPYDQTHTETNRTFLFFLSFLHRMFEEVLDSISFFSSIGGG